MPRARALAGGAGPVLKWAGGKGQLLPELLRRVPPKFGTYHEPFVGGGALYFALWNLGKIRRAVLSDINADLIGTYETIRDDVEGVIAALRAHRNEEAYFYEVRALDPAALTPAARAARIVFLNKTCFNGLYRVNSRGLFNVPFGDNPRATICDEKRLRAASRALQDAELRCEPFDAVARRAKRGDFVYFDPPYQPLSKTANFTAYSRGGFGKVEQRRLADVFAALAARGVHVLLSNSDAPPMRALYASFRRDVVDARRTINSKGTRRGKIAELLVLGERRPSRTVRQRKAKNQP